MAYLYLEETKLFKYNAYSITLTLTKAYIDSHFPNGIDHHYIYQQLHNMQSCCVTKNGYSLISCPVCCKNKKKFACNAYPPIVTVSECQSSPEICPDGSLKYTVSIKPVCSSSRNHLHTNIFLAVDICGEIYFSRSFSLLARKLQSKAKKLIKTDDVIPKKRGRPLNSVAKLPKEKMQKLSTLPQEQPIYVSFVNPQQNYQQIETFVPEQDIYTPPENDSFVDSMSDLSELSNSESESSGYELNNDFLNFDERDFFFSNSFDFEDPIPFNADL